MPHTSFHRSHPHGVAEGRPGATAGGRRDTTLQSQRRMPSHRNTRRSLRTGTFRRFSGVRRAQVKRTEHRPRAGNIGNIPALLQKHGSTKASSDELVTRVLWKHLAKSGSDCPLVESQQTALEASGEGVSSSKTGRAEADKERTVQDIGKDVGITFERRSVGGKPQHVEEYLEWILAQKWNFLPHVRLERTTSTSESSGRAHLDQEDADQLTLPKDDPHPRSNWTMDGVRGQGLPYRVANHGC